MPMLCGARMQNYRRSCVKQPGFKYDLGSGGFPRYG